MKWFALAILIPGSIWAQQNEWITTDEGCQMWNPYPFSVESVSWDGPCIAGKAGGEGKKVWLYRDEQGDKAKDTYQGQMENGKNHGEGIYKVDNGARYEGQWLKAKPTVKAFFTVQKVIAMKANGNTDKRTVQARFMVLKATPIG